MGSRMSDATPVPKPIQKAIVFEILVPSDHPAFNGHFPGNPIVPGVLLIDKVAQGLQLMTGLEVECIQQARFLSPLRPGEAAQVACDCREGRSTYALSVCRQGIKHVLATGILLTRVRREGGHDALD